MTHDPADSSYICILKIGRLSVPSRADILCYIITDKYQYIVPKEWGLGFYLVQLYLRLLSASTESV